MVSPSSLLQPRIRRSRSSLVLSRLLGVTLAALLVLPLAEVTRPVEAGGKVKTITKTFASNGQIDVPGAGTSGVANPYPTTIDVAAFEKFKKATITDVNLTLRGITHTDPDDINVLLSFGDRRAIVMSDVGGSTDIDGVTLRLDDEAAAEMPNSTQLTEGTFRPTNIGAGDAFPAPAPLPGTEVALSTFVGADPDGAWQLFVHDDGAGDTGSISGGWELEITAEVKTEKKDKDVKDDKKDKKGKKGKKGKKND